MLDLIRIGTGGLDYVVLTNPLLYRNYQVVPNSYVCLALMDSWSEPKKSLLNQVYWKLCLSKSSLSKTGE